MRRVSFSELKEFVVEEIWDLPDGITEDSALAHDFQIAGLDGKRFMEKFSSEFKVDFCRFDWVQYFGSKSSGNPFGLVAYLWARYLKGIPARDINDLPEITLRHLVHCANTGKWTSPG